MKDYAINLFYSENDEAWIADIPDLFSCSASGDTPEDALREVQIAKKLWLDTAQEDGDIIPEPVYDPADNLTHRRQAQRIYEQVESFDKRIESLTNQSRAVTEELTRLSKYYRRTGGAAIGQKTA